MALSRFRFRRNCNLDGKHRDSADTFLRVPVAFRRREKRSGKPMARHSGRLRVMHSAKPMAKR